MTEPLTSRMVFDQIRQATADAEKLNTDVRHFIAEMLRAKHEYEIAKDNLARADAEHFALAKDTGATEGLAKREAIRKTQIEIEIVRNKRKAYDDARFHKEQAESEASTMKAIIEGYASTSYALNRELKVFERSRESA